MASEDTQLIVGLEARVDAFEKAFNRAGQIADTKFSSIEKRAKQAGDRMREEMASSVEAINRVLGAVGVGLGLRELQEMADGYATLSARIKAASGSAEKGAAVMERLGQAAQRSRTSSDATASAYLKAKTTLDALGASTADQIKFQEAFNDAAKLSGASAEDAAGAMDALIKAMAEGSFSGKALGEILTKMPVLAKTLANALGVPVTSLKLLADQGKITGAAIGQALVAGLPGLRKQMAQLPETMGEAMTRLHDAMSEYVGKTAQASGVTAEFVAGLNLISDNFDKIGPVALAAGLAIAGVFTASAIIANPFLAVSAAVAGAAVALDEFLGKVEPIKGEMATLGDYGAAVWGEMKSGAVAAGEGLQHAFVVSVNAIIEALEYGEDANISFGDKVAAVAAKIMEAWHAVGGVIAKTAEAFADAGITLLNTMLVPLEEGLNKVIGLLNRAIEAANKLGASLKPIPEMTVKVFGNPYAGKANDLVGGAGDAITGEAKKIQRDANKRAVERDANSPSSGSAGEGSGNGAIDTMSNWHNGPNEQWEKDKQAFQERLNLMQAETAERKNFVGSFDEENAALDRTRTAQELLNEAQKAGLDISDGALQSSIAALADKYEDANAQLKALVKTEEEAKAKAKELSSAGEDMAKGFVKDLASGKGAAEALRNALSKLGDKMLDMGMDALWKSMTNNGTAFEGLARVITPAEPVVNTPGSSLDEVKKLAEGMKTTGTMSVTAGTVNVNGAGATGAAGEGSGALPDHPHTPTPRATDTTPTGSLESSSGDALHDRNLGMLPGGAAAAAGAGGLALHDRNLGAGFGGMASTGAPRQAIETYYGKPLTDSEYKDLINATSAEAGAHGNPDEMSGIMASILNRGRTAKGGIEGALHAPNQFQSVTGTRFNGHQPSQSFLDGPNAARRAQIEGSTGNLDRWGNDQTNFTAASSKAYGPGTNIGYRDNMIADGGQTYGGSVFNTAMTPPTIAAPQLASATQDITKLGQSAAGATGDLSSFGGSLGGLAKSLVGGIGGGGGGGLGLGDAGSLASLFGFASGGLISGDGTPTSDSNLAAVSDGEYIVNARAASKHMALLNTINSGKAPKLSTSGPSNSAFLNANAYSPTVNVHVDGGAADRQLAARIAEHVTNGVNQSARGFRYSGPQQHAAAHATISKAAHKNG